MGDDDDERVERIIRSHQRRNDGQNIHRFKKKYIFENMLLYSNKKKSVKIKDSSRITNKF